MKLNRPSKIRKFLIILLVLIIAIFLYLKVVPFGKISYERSWSHTLRPGKGFIYSFTPSDRLDSDHKGRITGDPVYFSVFTPRTFNKARLTIKYRDQLTDSSPIIEAGVLVDNLVWRYQLEPVENRIIEELKKEWVSLEEDDSLLLQRNNNYDNIESFKRDLENNSLKHCDGEARQCLASYNYPLDIEYHLPDHKSHQLTLNNPLRGFHQFYIYVNDGYLDLELEFVDLNQDKGADPITIDLYSGNERVAQEYLFDSNLSPTSAQTEEKKLSLYRDNLEKGVYKAEVKISDDMVIKKITSSSNKLSFINRVWPVSTRGNLVLVTDSNYLQVKALNPASLQDITFAGESFRIDKIYKQFDFQILRTAGLKSLRFKKDDIILENNSVFAWSSNSFFNPNLINLDAKFSLNEEIDYVVAEYQSPELGDGWKIATIELDLISAYREKGKYSFMISIPGLKAEDDINDYMEIDSIRIELEGRTLWQKINSWF